MMYPMSYRKVHELLYVLLPVLVLVVHHGVKHVPEVLESIFSRLILNN